MRLLPVLLACIFAAAPLALPHGQSGPAIFDGDAPLVLSLQAPLQRLFDKGVDSEGYAVDGTVTIQGLEPMPVRVFVRGNTSRRDTECTFPKLKLEFADAGGPGGLSALKIGTHCGENPGEELTGKFGRLANERAPWREVTVYRILDALGVPTLRARDARVTYVDSSPHGTIVPSPLTRNALIVEDDDAAVRRLGASGQIEPEAFTTARDLFRVEDSARLAFAQASIGNFDWCLAFSADDTYRCDARRKLWNLLAVKRDGGAFPVMKDFDLAGPVVGRHIWFRGVYDASFVESGSPIETEVVAQVQRTRALFPRAVLDATRREFLDRRSSAYGALAGATVDAHGRALAREYLDAFYRAIETDQAYYRPVVATGDAHVYTDPQATREACGAGDVVPPGTPVNERRRSGDFAQVALLDVMWRWASPNECPRVHQEPVWIRADAIGVNFPPR